MTPPPISGGPGEPGRAAPAAARASEGLPAAPSGAGDGSATTPAGAGDGEIDEALRATFGFESLRPGQAEVIRDVMAGTPVVAVMPTGAGKSLCYQLPAVVLGARGGLTLVVSPLIALMKDQVDALRARGVATAALTSAAAPEDQAEILDGIRAGLYTLVYVAPERFRSPRFLDALGAARGRLELVAVDEAHCISEWGHEFRPDYRRLGEAASALSAPRLIALTATATPEVREDIAAQLGLRAPSYRVSGFDRPNLCFYVEPAGGPRDKAERLRERVRRRRRGAAIVYAATRKNAERYAEALERSGARAAAYHAGQSDEHRRQSQEAFMAGGLDAIVATSAFGMGVDKADISVVVHADLPRSVEAYYQEAGRAGRDGRAADCVLLYNRADARLQEFLIDSSYPSPTLLRAVWRLARDAPETADDDEALRRASPGDPPAAAVRSARRILLRHGYLRADGGNLRAARPDPEAGFPDLDPEALARRAATERRKLASVLDYGESGGCRRRFLLDYFGDEARAAAPSSCGGCDVCLGRAPPAAPPRGRSREPARAPLSDPESRALAARLRRLRADLAADAGVPAYVVFSNKTLEALARSPPADERELLAIPGIGRGRLDAYGDAILAAVAERDS